MTANAFRFFRHSADECGAACAASRSSSLLLPLDIAAAMSILFVDLLSVVGLILSVRVAVPG